MKLVNVVIRVRGCLTISIKLFKKIWFFVPTYSTDLSPKDELWAILEEKLINIKFDFYQKCQKNKCICGIEFLKQFVKIWSLILKIKFKK